jgi:glycosyltransferase involved in cell wall biosynthesis
MNVLANGLAREGFEVQTAVLDVADIPLPFREAYGELSGAGSGEGSFRILQLNRRSVLDPLALLRLHRLVRRFQPDIVHTWNMDAAMYGGAALARWPQRWRRRGRSLGIGPARPHLVLGVYRIEPWKSEWQWSLARRLARNADGLVTNSWKVRGWYASRSFPVGSISVIPAGAAASRPSDISRAELLRELQLPGDARLIGVIGRLVPENRVTDLIWAADLLRVLHNNLRLVVIGDGPMRRQLEEYARLASDLEHIQFLGGRCDVRRIVAHLDVLWNGSENVGQSPAILDAMAAGVPVVASDTPTNRELIVENETGYLIALGVRSGRAARARHTDRIFSDHELKCRLSRAAHQRAAQHFNARRFISNYWDMYSRICK